MKILADPDFGLRSGIQLGPDLVTGQSCPKHHKSTGSAQDAVIRETYQYFTMAATRQITSSSGGLVTDFGGPLEQIREM